jgi:hypothetical protein
MKSLALFIGENVLSYLSYFAGDAGIDTILALDFFLFFNNMFYGLFLRKSILFSFDNAFGVDVPKVGRTLCD